MAMAGMVGMGALAYLWMNQDKKDRDAFLKRIRDEGITDPEEIWKICNDHHMKLKTELVEAQARIETGEEICRVGQGLADIRKMMEGEELPISITSRQAFGVEIPEKEMSAALKEIEQSAVPHEVKTAIIAHWWTELWQLFVPWGILTPNEIEEVKGPFFRLVGPEVREAVLRMEVYKYKEGYESFKKAYEEALKHDTESFEKHLDERDEWHKEKEEMIKAYDLLKATKTAIEASAGDEKIDD
jgi:hypothetical protein